MAGLLDSFFGTPDQTQALGLLGARMMQGNTAQGFADASQFMGGAKERALKEQYMQAQMQNMNAQAQERQAEAAQRQAALQRSQAIQQAVPSLYRQAGMTGGAPVPQEQGGVPMFSQPMGVSPMQTTPGGFNVQEALRLRMTPDEIKAYAGLENIGRQEVARTMDGRDAQGRPVTFQYDKYGSPVGQPVEQWKAPIFEALGNRRAAIDPVTLRERASFPIGQSPDSVASNAITMRGQNMLDARSREANAQSLSKPFEVTGPNGGPILVQQGKDGRLTPVEGFQPKGMGATKLTEDQGKATGWLVQAENAYKNMLSAGFDKDESGKLTTKSAAKPGLNDALERLPVVGGMANGLRSADRQKFMQASSSLSEALLRAATGAGVNAEEARQKIQELTPRFGEEDAATEQKMAAIPLYLESLRVRAGPGAARADVISSNAPASAPASGGAVDWRFENGKLVRVK